MVECEDCGCNTAELAVPLVQAGKVDVSIHAQIDLLKGKDPWIYSIPPYKFILESEESVGADLGIQG